MAISVFCCAWTSSKTVIHHQKSDDNLDMCSTTAATGGNTSTKKKVKKKRTKSYTTTSFTCEQATQDHELKAVGTHFTYFGPNSPGSCYGLPELDTNLCLDKEDVLKFKSDTYDGCFWATSAEPG